MKITISPLKGYLLKILLGINGIENGKECLEYPYDHLETNIKSPTNKFGFIDPDGILKGSKINERIRIAINIAKKIDFKQIEKNIVRCPDKNVAQKMIDHILDARKKGDSVGGIIELLAKGVPSGLGEPVFDRLDADLAKAMMSIPAVKGVEVGVGFAAAKMYGSECNDQYTVKGTKISTKTNNAGGIHGGISNGSDIVLRIVVKPTSSINKSQNTVTTEGDKTKIRVEGRHDPCVSPRAVPIAEAMMALTLIDHFMRNQFSQLK